MKLKTKKVLLLLSTIISLLLTMFYIFALQTGIFQLGDIGESLEINIDSQTFMFGICALANFISIFFISKDFIKHKKKLILLNIIQFLFGSICNIISAVVNIYLVSSKTEGIEETREKKELPILEDITEHKWYVYFIIFIFLFVICYSPLVTLLPIPETKIATIIASATLYIIQITLLAIPMKNELKRDFIAFKNNFKLYLSKTLPRFGIIIVFYIFCTLPITLLVGETSTNQEMINSLPLYISAFLAIVVGPFTEEIMFRAFIKKFIKNNVLFAIVSSLIFGMLHITFASSLQQILYIIPYSILGLAFSLNYIKTKNIVSNIFLHSFWNSFAVIVMILNSLV